MPFILATLSYFLGTLLTVLGIVHLDASVFMPLYNFQAILTPLLAFLILGEKFSPLSYLLMIIIVSGGILVSYSETLRFKAFISRPMGIFVIGLVFYSLADVFSGKAINAFGVLNFRFWGGLLLLIPSLLFIPFFRLEEKITFKKLVPVSATSVLNFFGLVFLLTGFSYNVSLSQILSRFSSVYSLIIVLILAKFKGEFLEKQLAKVYTIRFLGCLIMVVSVITLIVVK